MGVSGGAGPADDGAREVFGSPVGDGLDPVVVSAQGGEVVLGGGAVGVGDGVVEVAAVC